MIRRIPIIPTLLVLAAVAVMIRLGFWQLDRLHEKRALLARYAAAQSMSAEVLWPRSHVVAERLLYRRSRLDCRKVTGITPAAGRNAAGQPGWAHVAQCVPDGGGAAKVVLGWSRDLRRADWHGGPVTGVIAPGPRLVADPPLAGLKANARPDPSDIPFNHLSYAVQWFSFAGIALVIYALALRKRLRGK